jgi:hypothetical protein
MTRNILKMRVEEAAIRRGIRNLNSLELESPLLPYPTSSNDCHPERQPRELLLFFCNMLKERAVNDK